MTLEERIKMKQFLGKHYSVKVAQHLNDENIVNSDGNAFSSGSIRKIVNGFQSNDAVVLQILKYTAKVAQLQAENDKIRKSLIENL